MILSFKIYCYTLKVYLLIKISTKNNAYEEEFEKFRTEYSFYRYS